MDEIPRKVKSRIERCLDAFRVVIVTGPRQCGKTTLAAQVSGARGGEFRSLDDVQDLTAALADPMRFAQSDARPLVIDEVQYGGDALVRSIKYNVDRDKTRGRYLLTGSADFLTVPTLSESLAGRAVLLDMWPLSQGEIHGTADGFVDVIFDDPDSLRDGPRSLVSYDEYVRLICAGGYPEALSAGSDVRDLWFASLLAEITQRDIAEVTGARRATEIPKLLMILAARTAQELVLSQVQSDSGLSRETTADYIGFLRMTKLIADLPAWSTSHATRAKRKPKVHITDTGLAANMLRATPQGLSQITDPRRGPLTETFVANELRKQLGWSEVQVDLLHFRDEYHEIDLIVEGPDGRIVGIEIKAGLSFGTSAFKHLTWLRDRLGDRFAHGFVLSFADRPLSFGDRLTAVPISYLWEASS